MTGALFLHAELVELVWLAGALVGVPLALEALLDAHEDRSVVRSHAPGVDRYRRRLELALVDSDLASARWILAIETANLLIGVLAVLTPAPSAGRTPVAWALIVLLLFSAYALPARLYGQRVRRRAVLAGRLNGRAEP